MKTICKSVAKVSMALALLWLPALAVAAASPGAVRVKLAEGDVQIRIPETGEWAPVAANTPLIEGDEIWVPGGGRASLQTNGGARIRLGGGTSFQLLRTDRDAFQFHVSQGYVYVLRPGKKRGVLQFDTPDASVRSFGQSTFRIDIPDGETDIQLFKGSLTAETDDGATRVRSGSMLALGPGGLDELSSLPAPDDWQLWNEDLDRTVLARRSADRYLPPELAVYSDDFGDTDGRWVDVEGYGNCWAPTIVDGRDWAPYRHGRWCWRGGDYVWIGDEPWGWAPYHYGRWAFEARVGWFWVPPERGNIYWAPGYVGWIRTPDHVAWVPLAPREVYYGHGNYGRYSVDITKTNVGGPRVTNVYRNVNVVNSITVVQQSTFSGGRPSPVTRDVMKSIHRDFLEHRGGAQGRPAITPSATSYLPVIRRVPDSKRPPENVRKIDTGRLRQDRSLVMDINRSAIRPGAAPKPLHVRKVEVPRPPAEKAGPRLAEPATPGNGTPQKPPDRKNRPDVTPGGPANRAGRESGPAAPPAPAAPTRPEGGRLQAVPAPDERSRPHAPPPRGERVHPTPPADRIRPQAPPPRPEPVRPQVVSPPVERVRPQVVSPPVERVRPKVVTPPAERVRPQAPPPRPEPVRPQAVPPPVERVRPQAVTPPAERVRPQAPPPRPGPVRPGVVPPPEKGGRPEPKQEKGEHPKDKERGDERGGEGHGGR